MTGCSKPIPGIRAKDLHRFAQQLIFDTALQRELSQANPGVITEMTGNLDRAEIIKEAIRSFNFSPHGISVLRSKILTSTSDSDLDGINICNTFAPVGVNNPAYRKDLLGLEIIATLMEVDPSLSSALEFSKFVSPDKTSREIISALQKYLPPGVSLEEVLNDRYKAELLYNGVFL